MAPLTTTHGHANGHTNGTLSHTRFSDIPAVIDIPVRGEDGDEAVNLDLTELIDETDELCDLLENENAAKIYWITIALAYARQKKVDIAIDILQKGLQSLQRGRSEDRLSLLSCLCWLYLWRCRRAPRVKPTQPSGKEGEAEKTKDHWLHAATSTLNDASRLNPAYPPLFLARGTLYLLRASLQPTTAASARSDGSDRAETLKQAAKCFDDAYRLSGNKNLMAAFGKAKVQFSLARYAEAHEIYRQILLRAPDLTDPDPRIGIGCCLWQLGHKQPARQAWERSLELNPETNVSAHILLGLSFLDESAQFPTTSTEFAENYKKAMTTHTQTSFKLDPMHAMTCATFGSYFLLRKTFPNVERLARRAIEMTDVNAVASDGWYLLARKEHYMLGGEGGEGDVGKANEYYTKADQARGGDERGYLPAKFGAAQLKVLMRDFDGAKFRLEKIVSTSSATRDGVRSVEALTLLGVLCAEEVFANQAAGGKEDKSLEQRKAIGLLEQVRLAWKDPKRKLQPDALVLLNLARLYELDAPDKALTCLEQVEKMELDEISDEDDRLPEDIGDEAEERRVRRELLSPQLLNNIGCLHFEGGKYAEARDDFQTALNACVKMGDKEDSTDTDALVSTISFNLARTYEAESLLPEARKIYEGLLERHPAYIDAQLRLTLITLQTSPSTSTGAEDLRNLLETYPANLDVRALYAWHLHRTKKRAALPDDAEQRHYKHTLQTYDKHDLYSLTGMGNLHLSFARDMRRETDQEKEKRGKMYMRAVEFFDKVLTLDGRSAYAAQGLAIAVVEGRKDVAAGIQVLSKVRESLKGTTAVMGGASSVFLNLGHVFAETRQWSRSIENYELALARSRTGSGDDGAEAAGILTCLGRAWLLRGRQEKKLEAYKSSLDFSRQALDLRPEEITARFNVAFVQMQLAQLLISLPEAQRTLGDVESASAGLDEAIEAFLSIAGEERRPFPRGDLEARANMGRNTMKRQLAQAVERQAAWERGNKDRLEEARRKREEEMQKRETERVEALARAEEQRRVVKEERERMAEADREMITRRLEEEKVREAGEWTDDPETGERKKREKRARGEKKLKRKKKGDELEDLIDDSGTPATGSDGEAAAPVRRTKKRRLEKRGNAAAKSGGKYKSAETVEDSDEGGDDGETTTAPATQPQTDVEDVGLEEEEDGAVAARPSQLRKKQARVLDDEDDEEEDELAGANGIDVAGVDEGVATAGDENHG